MRLSEFRPRARRKMKTRIAIPTTKIPAPMAMRPLEPEPAVSGGTVWAAAGGGVATGVCGEMMAAFVGSIAEACGGMELVWERGTDGAGDGAGWRGAVGVFGWI